MRVVVADATPLHYLILIAVVQVLPRLFEKIHVPIEVREELSCEATPPIVRTWMEQPPQWLEVLAAPVVASEDSSLQALDSGERAAIVLAESISADLLLAHGDATGGRETPQEKRRLVIFFASENDRSKSDAPPSHGAKGEVFDFSTRIH